MSKKRTTKEFIKESNIIHHNKYDYSLVDYKNRKEKVWIICPKHGLFQQIPYDHLNGHGCKDCADEYISNLFSSTKEEFIEKAKEKYGDFYDYSLVDYKNQKTEVDIICPKHGLFKQTPQSHLHSGGCFKCGIEGKFLTEEQVLNKLSTNFNYSNLIKIGKCSDEFQITGTCKKCGFSKTKSIRYFSYDAVCDCERKTVYYGEEKCVELLNNKKIFFIRNKKFDDLKDVRKLSYDFFVPDFNLLIECQGEQHKKPKNFGGISKEKAERNFLIQTKHDKMKKDYAIKNGYNLLEIDFKDFDKIDEILENYICKLGQRPKEYIYG